MPTRRMIDPAIWQSESMASLTRDQRLLFFGLLFMASNEGTYPNVLAMIAREIFFNDGITEVELVTGIQALEQVGLVGTSESTIFIENFWDYVSHYDPKKIDAWIKLKRRVYERDNYLCVYCGDLGEHIDHIHPKSRGGQDVFNNLATACQRCNFSKSNKGVSEWYIKQPFFSEKRLEYVNNITACY